MCQILSWNHVGRLVLAIKSISFVIDINYNITIKKKLVCIFNNATPIFIYNDASNY
jgi:hypothetical protein